MSPEAFKPLLRTGTDPKTKDLLKKLDGLPLALATAGAYLGLTSIPVSEYLHHHETSWLELQRTSPPLLSYADQTIYSTWNLSYIDIRKEDESAAKLLELWGYFDNQDLWYGLLKAGNDKYAPAWFGNIVGTKLAFQAAIAKLQKHALIESLTDSDGYAMHHCVHAWVKNVLCTAVEDQKLKLALTCFEKGVPFYPAPGDWITRQRMTSHSERCLQLHRVWIDEGNNSEETEQYFARFFHNLGVLYHDQGKPKEAESTYQRALISNEKLLGPHHIIILNTINNLGSLYCEQGKLIEAESIYQRALNGKVKAFGPDHTFTLNTVESLGILYNKQGKLTEAELLYQRALSGKEKVLGPDHTSTLDTVNNLGILYKEQGKLTEAELMYQRALNGYEKTLGHDHKFTLNTINNLGILYSEQGKLTEAESMYNRVLAGYEETLGHDHISALNTINNLGILYSEQGKLTEAESMYNRVLAGYEETLGHDHKSTLDAAHNLGRLYSFQKDRLAEAESMYQRALTDYEETLGHDHRSTLDTVFNLGNLYSHQEDRLAEAESMYQRALTGFEETLGHDHIFTLDTVFNLGNLYSHQEDRLAEAESMYQRALAGFTRNPPLNPKSQLNTFYNLGLLSRKLQNFERAKECFKKAYQGYQTLLGPENAETIKALEQFNVEVERGKQGVEEEDTEGSSKTDCEPDSSL